MKYLVLLIAAVCVVVLLTTCASSRKQGTTAGPPLLDEIPCDFSQTCVGPNLVKHLRKQHKIGLVWCDEPQMNDEGLPLPFKRANRVIGSTLVKRAEGVR